MSVTHIVTAVNAQLSEYLKGSAPHIHPRRMNAFMRNVHDTPYYAQASLKPIAAYVTDESMPHVIIGCTNIEDDAWGFAMQGAWCLTQHPECRAYLGVMLTQVHQNPLDASQFCGFAILMVRDRISSPVVTIEKRISFGTCTTPNHLLQSRLQEQGIVFDPHKCESMIVIPSTTNDFDTQNNSNAPDHWRNQHLVRISSEYIWDNVHNPDKTHHNRSSVLAAHLFPDLEINLWDVACHWLSDRY